MSYYQQAEQLNLMVKAYGLKPEQLNIMIKFAKVVRRSAKQNKVLWNIVDTMIKDTPMKLELEDKTSKSGKTYQAYRVIGTEQKEDPELAKTISQGEDDE